MGTIKITGSLQKGKLRHRAATTVVSSRAGIGTQDLRDSRVLKLWPLRIAPPSSAPLYWEMLLLLGDLGKAPEEMGLDQSLAKEQRMLLCFRSGADK